MNTITSPRLGLAQLEQLRARPRDAHAVDELVDEDVVADLERRIHRARRDLERLDHERAQRERDQDRGADRFDVVARRRFRRALDRARRRSASSAGSSRRTRCRSLLGEALLDLGRSTVSRSPALPRRPALQRRAPRAPRARGTAPPCARADRAHGARMRQSTFRIGQERLLRDLDGADRLHALLALLLLLEELLLARDVAAVALRGDVLADRLHRRARDDAAADRGLDRDVEHLPRHDLLHLRRTARRRGDTRVSRCEMIDSASTRSPLTSTSSRIRSASR